MQFRCLPGRRVPDSIPRASAQAPGLAVSRLTNRGGPRGLRSSHSRKALRRLAGGRSVRTGSHALVPVMVTASGQGSPVDLQALSLLLKALLSDSRASAS